MAYWVFITLVLTCCNFIIGIWGAYYIKGLVIWNLIVTLFYIFEDMIYAVWCKFNL